MHLKRLIKLKIIRIMRIHDKRERIARGFAWGTFLAIFPSCPFNTALSFLAPVMGGNIIAALLGAWLVGPFITSPFWYWLSYLTGKWIFNLAGFKVAPLTYLRIKNFLIQNFSSWDNTINLFSTKAGWLYIWDKINRYFWALEFGGLILGIIGAVIAYKFIYRIETWFLKHKKMLQEKRLLKRMKIAEQKLSVKKY